MGFISYDKALKNINEALQHHWGNNMAGRIRCTTSCGEVNIGSPFRLRGDSTICGDLNFELACIDNRTVLDPYSGNYSVRYINYTNYTIGVADMGLQKGNCSSLPHRSSPCRNFFISDSYTCWDARYSVPDLSKTVSIVGCRKVVDSHLYIDTSSCLDGAKFSNSFGTRRRLYAMVDANVSNVETGCTIEHMAMIPWWVDGNHLRSYAQIHEQMVYGFELSWLQKACKLYFKGCAWCGIDAEHQIYCGANTDVLDYLSDIRRTIKLISLHGIGNIKSSRCGINFVFLNANI
ncbi:uncharacterized protein LOC115663329 [Syzygium oleosum]|uniref:uncharacterized protein LOC115663329 n=1 Tax=Syzygium oleosum TaxID=219896 RepID=UPI0024BA86CB|nr:uncharacterized protein LOC115663329 [Syzygium oleosum]